MPEEESKSIIAATLPPCIRYPLPITSIVISIVSFNFIFCGSALVSIPEIGIIFPDSNYLMRVAFPCRNNRYSPICSTSIARLTPYSAMLRDGTSLLHYHLCQLTHSLDVQIRLSSQRSSWRAQRKVHEFIRHWISKIIYHSCSHKSLLCRYRLRDSPLSAGLPREPYSLRWRGQIEQ